MGKRVLVCGGRDFNDLGVVWSQLDTFHNLCGGIDVIIQGGAKGADALAKSWAYYNRVPIKEFPADWNTYGNRAGPIRNGVMLRESEPDLVIAFPGGVGTRDMISKARAAGVEVIRVR